MIAMYQRGRAVRIDGIEVGARGGQRVDTFTAPCRAASIRAVNPPRGNAVVTIVAASTLTLGKSGVCRDGVQVGAARSQQRYDLAMILGGGPHHRRLSLPAFPRIDIRPRVDEQLHCRGLARRDASISTGLAVGTGRIGTSAPAPRSNCTTGALPLTAASASGVKP